jgi:hypothetical protein
MSPVVAQRRTSRDLHYLSAFGAKQTLTEPRFQKADLPRLRAGEGRRLASRTERGRISGYFDAAPGAEIRRVEESVAFQPGCADPRGATEVDQHPPKNKLAVELTRRDVCSGQCRRTRCAIGLALTHSPSCKRLVRKPAGGLAANDQGASTATGESGKGILRDRVRPNDLKE